MERKLIIDAIKEAFNNVRLNSGLTVRQCVAIDNRDDPISKKYADITDYDIWADIPETQVVFFGTHGVLIHGGIDGCLFHLPAALIYVARNIKKSDGYESVWDILNSILFQLEQERMRGMLNSAQKKAVVDWLKFILSELGEDSVFAKDITELAHCLVS